MTVPRQKLPRGDIFNETGGLPVKNEPRPASMRGRGSGLKPREAQGSIGYETRAELFYAGAVTDVEPTPPAARVPGAGMVPIVWLRSGCGRDRGRLAWMHPSG